MSSNSAKIFLNVIKVLPRGRIKRHGFLFIDIFVQIIYYLRRRL